MTSTATTVVGWSLILGVGGIAYWQYTKSNGQRLRSASRSDRPSGGERQRATSKERRRKEKATEVDTVGQSPAVSKAEHVKSRKKNKERSTQPLQAGSSSAIDATSAATKGIPIPPEPVTDDLAFAQQLSRTQSGTNLRAPERNAQQKVRTNKVKSGTHEAGWQSSGTPSSQDASPARSPSIDAVPDSKDVTGIEDMLEAPAPGPATLRVIPSEKPQREAAPRKAKPVVEPETKRQRQRRRKREAEKEQAAIDEQERRRLMEKQLKTARMAEGTAKSGQYRTYTPPATNAWNQAGQAVAPRIAPVANSALLDTFEADASPPAVDALEHGGATSGDVPSDESRPSIDSEPASSAAGSVDGSHPEPVIADHADLDRPGQHSDAWEDYQLRTFEQREKANDGWTEVPAKGKKRAAR